MSEDKSADYVIVGAGSAGAVLANRLSENPDTRVILIEAGGEATSFLVQIPVGYAKLIANRKYDWCYEQEPDASIHGRRFLWSAGKLLGGSSSINGQVFIRGTRRDFDRWGELGATGWNFDAVWPYFLRSEDWSGPSHPAHASGGPLTVSPMQDVHPLCRNFLQACAEIGLPTLSDYHGGDMEGAFLTAASQRGGWRCSTEKSFLRPIRSRPNLQVLTHTEAEQILFENNRAVGVRVKRGGAVWKIRARREVLVSAGTVGSAALLLRSGIGAAAHLRSRGVPVILDLPGVGENLQEHVCVGQHKFVNVPTFNSEMGPLDMVKHMARFLSGRKGPLGAPTVQAMAMARTSDALAEPDVQLHFMPLSYDIEPDTVSTARAVMPKEPSISITTTICQPKSRGRVELDADLRPKIAHQFLGDPRDVDTLVAGQHLLQRLFGTSALRSLIIADRRPSPMPVDTAGWADYVRWQAAPGYHPVGTCRMGSDERAVVDPSLKLRGIAGLRVIDASVMPTPTSSNTNAAVIMIGERGADMILKEHRP